jgi:hypothetical protein
LLGCASRQAQSEPANLPQYGGEQAALFSDLFRPELFGIDGSAPPENDSLLVERTQRADVILPVRVITISRETRGEVRNYTVVAQPAGAVIRGKPITEALTLNVAARSPAFAFLDSIGSRWVGTRLLLFLRYYADGPHFYGTLDNVAVRNAIASVKIDTSVPRPK